MTRRALFVSCSIALIAAPALAQAPAAPSSGPDTASHWRTQIDLGWVQASGNSRLSTLHVAEQVTYHVDRWKFTQDFTIVNGSTGGTETANNLAADLRADFAMTPRLALYALDRYERDRFAGLSRRMRQEAGLSFSALAVPMDTLNLEAGAGATQEKLLPDSNANFATARGAARYRHTFRANTFAEVKGEVVQNLKNSNDTQVNADAALVAPVSRFVAVKLGYTMRYQHAPVPGHKTTDTIASAGIQVVF